MFRSLAIVAAISLLATASAYVGSNVSGFGGKVLVSGAANSAGLEMKKGKLNMPPQMRSQYAKQKEMASMREEMIAATKPGPDGFPVFNLYVRTPRANMWYPCGSFKGDDRSKALCTSYADGGIFAGMAKKQLDEGIGGSLAQDSDKLLGTIVRGYPQLKKSKNELEFGYKIAFKGLSDDLPITLVEIKAQKGFFDNIKSMFS